MINIPEWFRKIIVKALLCPKCKKPVDLKNIVSLGIKMSSRFKDKEVFFVDYFCYKCKCTCYFELDHMSADEFFSRYFFDDDDKALDDSVKEFENMLKHRSDDDLDENDKYSEEDDKDKQDIWDALNNIIKNMQSANKPSAVSKISNEEVFEMKRILAESKSWEDILKGIGVSSSEIKKFNYKKGNRDKK